MRWRRRHRPKVTFEVDDVGVRRLHDGEPYESVQWDRLASVTIRTTSGGPWSDDVLFVLMGDDGSGVVIGSEVATPLGLLPRLQALPGFDNLAVIDAMGCTDDAVFPCWTKPSPA